MRASRVPLALSAFAAGFLLAVHMVRLDRMVVARFEGRLFRVPSRVFSAPMILYPGLDWKRADLMGTLTRLGYRQGANGENLPPGHFVWRDDAVRVHLAAFDHPSRYQQARDILVRLDGGTIEEIRDLALDRPLGAVLVEPELVGAYYGPDREQRELVRLREVPWHLLEAVLAIEDQRFETHHGLDFRRILGAVWANVQAGKIRQGASTLTQQLVKNFFLTPERTLRRKLEEALVSLVVEARYNKDEILEAYLNEIYLGQRGATAIHGVGEAAHLYFGKHPRHLRISESALLAAIIQSPNGISPYRDPARATKRRNLVLALMRKQGRIDDRAYSESAAEPLHLSAVTPDPGEARYFLDFLRRQLPEIYGAQTLATEGMRIYSTLDLRLQRIAAQVLREGLERLEAQHPGLAVDDPSQALQGCIVALRPQTGELLALVGGRSYGLSQYDRCSQARRPVGSVFKPFVYIAALEPGSGGPVITLADFLDDGPLDVPVPGGVWSPENYDHEFHGRVMAREALERSLNVATARLALEVGIDRVVEVAGRLGISSRLPEVPSLALGTGEVSPLEIARAYATIASGGVRPEIHAFEDLVAPQGYTLERRHLSFERVLDAGTAYLATSLLEGVVERGTAASVRAQGMSGPIAGKTGTSDGERDLWFVGFTPELVVVVWLGFDEPRSVGLPSSVAAIPIWVRFMERAVGKKIRGAFLPPPDVVRLDVDPASGALALSGCPERRPEYFLEGTEPEEVCSGSGRRGAATDGVGPDGRPGGFVGWLRDLM